MPSSWAGFIYESETKSKIFAHSSSSNYISVCYLLCTCRCGSISALNLSRRIIYNSAGGDRLSWISQSWEISACLLSVYVFTLLLWRTKRKNFLKHFISWDSYPLLWTHLVISCVCILYSWYKSKLTISLESVWSSMEWRIRFLLNSLRNSSISL